MVCGRSAGTCAAGRLVAVGIPLVVALAAWLWVGPALAASPTLSGKLWIVAAGANAGFPVPSATPDATFTTNHAVFIGEGAELGNVNIKFHYTIGPFLKSVAAVSRLTFSGQFNSVLNGVASAATVLSDGVGGGNAGTYGTFIELKGQVPLFDGQVISISHDDGVALEIDGSTVSGFTSGSSFPRTENVTFTGTGGVHTIDLAYVEDAGGPALLVFSPVP